MKLSDYLKAINQTKVPMEKLDEDFEYTVKKYVPFVINRCLSYFPDTIMQVNEMNRYSHLPKKMQYDYLLHSTRNRNRYSEWLKKEESDDVVMVASYYKISLAKARE
ncbi:MAG: DNA polymerase clamp loader subunit A, partial [Candidatus Peribacter sp.]|nr:DNA polymerase clamp loader subunit A [Candidatus Peribacter sp.]